MLLLVEIFLIILLAVMLFMLYRREREHVTNNTPQAKLEEYWDGKERREHVRFKDELKVTYVTEKKPHLNKNGTTIDISKGGVKLMLDEKLTIGTIVNFKVYIPSLNKPAEVEGEVVWSSDAEQKDPSGKRLFYSGLKFLAISETHTDSISQYIRALNSKRVG